MQILVLLVPGLTCLGSAPCLTNTALRADCFSTKATKRWHPLYAVFAIQHAPLAGMYASLHKQLTSQKVLETEALGYWDTV